ncbi:MAG: C40 family peptidase [Schwartzia sp.]|nr:C40 family peptidase [Schwartzia sp. (in: firmicutes)]
MKRTILIALFCVGCVCLSLCPAQAAPSVRPSGVHPSHAREAKKTVGEGKMEKAVRWAIRIADDQRHGYSQGPTAEHPEQYDGDRDGPDYDCSSLVYWALDHAGFPIIDAWRKNPIFQSEYQGKQKVGDADTVWPDLQVIGGFTRYTREEIEGRLMRGDILCNPDTHIGLYIGDGKTVEAKGVNYGERRTGDQGREIDFFDADAPWWTEVYRYTGEP